MAVVTTELRNTC